MCLLMRNTCENFSDNIDIKDKGNESRNPFLWILTWVFLWREQTNGQEDDQAKVTPSLYIIYWVLFCKVFFAAAYSKESNSCTATTLFLWAAAAYFLWKLNNDEESILVLQF